MSTSTNLYAILAQVKQLDKEAQLTLLQRLASLLKQAEPTPEAAVRLSFLSGLGSGLWKSDADIDRYLDEERQW